MLERLEASGLLKNGARAAVAVEKASNFVSKMCFVAGTLVLTKTGLMRIVGEVVSMLIPAGAAGKVLSKIEVLQRLRQTKLFQQVTKTLLAAREAALAVTNMCFEAGVPVKLDAAGHHIAIEEVQAGMEVWARDEETGKECRKRVVQTFTTHPTELYRLTYEVRGPPESGADTPHRPATSETLGVTGPHPFWVSNREQPGFVMAEELQTGDVLFISGGHQAVVTSKVLEHAPLGETFTTYNFEVEDYHTYFVGEAEVWVHNTSPRSCQEALEMFAEMLEHFSNNITSAWLKTSQAIAAAKMAGGDLLQLKLFTEVRPKWLANLANSVPPWLNTAIQHLPAGAKGSAGRLRANMEKVLGIKKPKGMASHHIVEKADNPLVRDVLERAGIHIDEAANGVWLPRQKMLDEYAARGQSNWLDGVGPRHEGSHTQRYSDAVAKRIIRLDGLGADVIRNELQSIAKELIEGTFPWP